MFEGFDARYKRHVETLAAHACWIINYCKSVKIKKAIRPTDLVKWDGGDQEFETPEEAKAMIDNLLAYQKTKCWTKISDKYAPKNLKESNG